jgi:hypothetical protein
MRALFKMFGFSGRLAVVVFLAAGPATAQDQQLLTPLVPGATPGVTSMDGSPCADTDASCWGRWLEIAKRGCLLIGSSPAKAMSQCMDEFLMLSRLEQASTRLAQIAVAHAKSDCPRDDAKDRCSLFEAVARQDSEFALQALHALSADAQRSVQMLKCRLGASSEEDLANCYCAGKPENCKAELAKEYIPECYRTTADRDVWKCLCRNHLLAEMRSEERLRECVGFWVEADKKMKVNVNLWNLKCPPGNHPDICGENSTLEAKCLADGMFCCGKTLCPVAKRCLSVSPDPALNMGVACVDADIEYCAGIGLCPKGTNCWTFGGRPACLPPETDECKTFSDCGLIGPHECTVCCPRYHSHPFGWPREMFGIWCIAGCRCDPGPAPDDDVVYKRRCVGKKMIVEFASGSSTDLRLKASVRVSHDGKSAFEYVEPGSTPGMCAAVAARVAWQVGVTADLEGLNKVVLCGEGIAITTVSGCALQCTAPNCSN